MTRKRPKILAAEPARPGRDLIDLVVTSSLDKLTLSECGEFARLHCSVQQQRSCERAVQLAGCYIRLCLRPAETSD